MADRLLKKGLALPDPPSVVGSYVPATRCGLLVFTSGQLPFRDGVLLARGAVDSTVSEEVAVGCAREAALNALAAAGTVCDIDDVSSVIKLVGYVNSGPGFSRQPAVIDGASEVLLHAFGDEGRHAREAVGVAGLPLDAPVEVSLVLCLREKASFRA